MPQTRKLRHSNDKFAGTVQKRGSLSLDKQKKKTEDSLPIGPVAIGLVLVVVVGSALFQLIRAFSGQAS